MCIEPKQVPHRGYFGLDIPYYVNGKALTRVQRKELKRKLAGFRIPHYGITRKDEAEQRAQLILEDTGVIVEVFEHGYCDDNLG